MKKLGNELMNNKRLVNRFKDAMTIAITILVIPPNLRADIFPCRRSGN